MTGFLRRIICLTLAFLLTFNPMLAAAGGIVTDPKAPAGKQPGLNAAANGVPLIDIARPNSKGLSHNMFDQFNVGKPGVIMNNSNKLGRTQLGGVVANNPNLGGGVEARTILNEVTGGSRSQLEGYTEIFGYPADYILANPNGITVNGGGFINTPKATLTTGKPRLDETGGLKFFDVRKGEVFIDGLGLNVENLDAFDIISRTAKINADIHAKNLGITTGYGRHDPVTGLFSALPADGSSAPVVALDSTALGGMYADRIVLVGNEKGVGVNLEGITRATDELVLTADGKIRIKGAVSSNMGVSVTSVDDSVEIAGSLAAATVADVKAAKSLKLQSGTAGKALLYGADVNISTGLLNNADGRIEAGKSLAVNTATDVINAGVIRAGSNAVLNAGGAVRNSGQVEAENSLTVDSRTLVKNSGRLISIGAVKIHSSGGISNSGGEILAKGAMTLKSAGNIANTGVIETEGQAKISAVSLTNTDGSILAKDAMALETAGKIVNTGTIGTDREASISAGSLANTGGSILAQGDLDLAVTNSLSNSGMLYSGAFNRIRAGGMRNDPAGQVLALNSLTLEAGADLENQGIMSAGETLSMRIGGSLLNTGGSILAQTGLDLASLGDIKNSGSIQSGGAGSYQSGGILFNAGDIVSKGDLELSMAGDLSNSGTIASGADAVFSIRGSLLNTIDGQMQAAGAAVFDVNADLSNSGQMQFTGMGSFSVGGGLFNTGGAILSQTALDFDVLGATENTGTLHSGDLLSLHSSSLGNSGQMLAAGMTIFDVTGDLRNSGLMEFSGPGSFSVGGGLFNTGGDILSQAALDFNVLGAMDNTGTLHSGDLLSLRSDSLGNSGRILAGGTSLFDVTGDLRNSGRMELVGEGSFRVGRGLSNTGGDILSKIALDFEVLGAVDNTGTLYSGDRLSLSSDSLDNSGRILAAGESLFDVTGDLRNSGRMQFTGMSSFSVGGGLFNTGGAILSQTALDFDVLGALENTGTLHSGDLLSLSSVSVDNSGQILAAGMSVFDVTGDLRNSGRMEFTGMSSFSVGGGLFNKGGNILSQTGLDFDVLGAVDNTGTLYSGDGLSLSSVRLDNSGQILAAGESLFDVTGDLRNSGRMQFAGGGAFSVGGGLLNTGGNILSQTALEFDVQGALKNTGTLHSGGLLSLSSSSVDNSGQILAAGMSVIDVTGDLRNTGLLEFTGEGSFSVGRGLFNTGGDILSQTALDFDVLGTIDNTGSLYSGGRLSLSSGRLDNSGQILAAGASLFDVTGDLRNSGRMEFTGGGAFSVGGGLLNTGGNILSQTALDFDVQGALENTGILHSGDFLSLRSASVDNSGQILAQGDSAILVQGDLINSNFLFSGGESNFSVGGVLHNVRGQILSLGDMVLEGLKAGRRMLKLQNDSGTIETLEGSMSIRAKVVRNTNLDIVVTPGTEVVSRKGGYSPERRDWRTWWIAGLTKELQIMGIETDPERLSISQSELEAAVAAAEIRFALYGGSPEDIATISNLKCRLLFGDFYATLPGASEVAGKLDAMIISSADLLILGFGLDRTVIMRSELDAAIAAAEARFAVSGGNPDEIAAVSSLKSRMVGQGTYLAIQHNKYNSDTEAAYLESITRDEVIGMESSANIAAAVNLDIEAESFRNSVSRVSTAIGDINIDTGAFENVGHNINEYHTVQWSLGRVYHEAPILSYPRNVIFHGNGVEVVKTPIDYAYSTISAGGKAFISADHVNNGISENTGVASSVNGKVSYKGDIKPQGGIGPQGEIGPQGGIGPQGDIESQGDIGPQGDVGPQGDIGPQGVIIAPPKPGAQVLGIRNIDALIGSLPKDGLFSVNKTPGHRYLIETNPALTSVALFYGSDYFLDQTGINLSRTHQQLLGDAFYESRLVREQVFALTGRRYLSASVASDGEQMLALMDNAIAARKDLNLSVGVALTVAQIAALSSDIVWLETRVVDGHEVLVPVVYLCRASLDTIAQGGSVIIGRDVEIRTTGDTVNRGVIKASRDLSINADNIFNTFGTIQGDTLTLATVDSIFNTSGLIKGRDVSLDAGKDIISRTAKTTFSAEGKIRSSFTRTSSETVGQRGSIEATGDLSMQAGRDIEVIGSDVKAGGDATLDAGRNVVIAAQDLESHNAMKTGRSKGNYNTQTSKAATVEAGGSVNISAGQDVAVHGSHVSAAEDVSIEAGRDITITSATEGYDYYYEKKSKGGVLGGSSSEMRASKVTNNAASTITAGGDVNMEAGKGGGGDLAVVGSRVEAGADMNLRARDGILVSSAQESESMISASSESKLFSGKSKASGDAQVTQVGSEIVAGNDLHAEAKNVAVSASQIHAGNDVVIKSTESDVIVSGAQNTVSAYRYEKKDGWNLNAPLEIPLAILSGDGVEFYSSKMKEGKDTASFNFGSQITAGNNVEVDSARDAVVIGSTVAAGNDVNINAVRDANLIPGLSAQTSERRTKEKSIGFTALSISENEIKSFAGVTKKETGSKFTGDYNAGSVVSAGNDVKIEAGNNVNQFSSGIEAGRDVTLKSGNDINVDANKDIEHMEQYARQIQIGVTATASQSVTTAVRTLVDTPNNIASGEGSDAAKGITEASSILRDVSAAQQLTNVGASASITAGTSVSQSSSFLDAADAVSSSIRAGRDVELDAERDVKIAGAVVQAEEDVSIQAGRDVEIKSATNTYSAGSDSYSASAGAGIGASYNVKGGAAAGIRVQAEAAGSKNTSNAQTHANSAVAAGETLSVKSGADTTVAGANLEGKKVAMDVGGDLVVKSEQDKRAAAGSNWNAGGSATFGYGFSADAHVGMGKSKADSAWVNKQTSIIGQEKVDIRTEKNTHVEGAVIAAENGNLKLDTGTLTYKDIEDHDKSKNFQVSLSGSYSSSGEDQKDANGSSSSASGTLDAGYSSGDRRQINRATIGEGEIIIRLDPSKGLEGLNRDLEKAREITRDDAVKVQVYVDSDALSELIDLIEKALEDPKTNEEAVKLLAELVSKGVITKKQADALLFKRSFTKAELKVAEEELSRMVNMNDPHQLAAYVDSLSPQERAAVAAVSMEEGRSQQEYELGLIALVGGTTYLKVLNVNSPSEYRKLKIQPKDLMPLGTWEKEQALVDSAANSYAANNNLEVDMATYRNAQSETERIQALNRIAADLGKAWGIDNVTVKIVPPNEKLGKVIAYADNTLESGFFSSKFSTDYIICIPENSEILNEVMVTGDIVHVFTHEITHMRQVSIMNNQISGQKTDLGYLFVANSKMYVNPKEVYGLYASQPLETHANAVADKFFKNSADKGVVK